MTNFDSDWAAAQKAKRAWMSENSLYRREDEHAS